MLSGWKGFDTITVDTAKVSGTSTEVVGIVDLSSLSATWWSNVKSDGSDVAITTDGSDTKLARELVGFDSGTSEGLLYFGPVTLSSASADVFRVYSGNASASESDDTATLWTDYDAVYHFEEDPSGTSPQLTDSTGNGYDGTSNGSMTSGDMLTGQLGSSWDFDGSNDYVDTTYAPTALDSFSIQYWVNYTQTSRGDALGVLKEDGTNDILVICYTNVSAGKAGLQIGDGDGNVISTSGTTTINDGSWHHVVLTYNDGTGTVTLHVDSNEDVSSSQSFNTIDLTSNSFFIGAPQIRGSPGSTYLDGELDEIRFRPSALSANQIATEYEIQNSPSTFFTYNGWESNVTQDGWTHYETITSNTAKITGTSTQIVGVVDLSDLSTGWWSNVKADGSDIVILPSGSVTTDDKLAYELVGFDTGTSTGVLYFGPITVSSSASDSWDLWVGNSSASETQDTATLWADCVGVYHFEEDPSGTAPQIVDSTGTQDGTSVGSMTSGDLVTGHLGDSIDFDGSDDYINIPYNASQYVSSITVMGWFNVSTNTNDYFVSNQDNTGTAVFPWYIRFNNTASQIQVGFDTSGGFNQIEASDSGYRDGSWHQVVATYDETNGNHDIYLEGSAVGGAGSGTISGGGAIDNNSDDINIGRLPGNSSWAFDGLVDEIRIYDGALSSDQIATEYEVQNNPSAFWTFSGVKTPLSGSWTHYATIDSDNTKVTGTSTEVVGVVDLSQFDSTWWSNVKSDGSDIVIVPEGSDYPEDRIARELVGFNTGTSTGILYFGPITLTSASSTSYDVWVGNSSASESDSTSVWTDKNYVAVYHMEEDPSGSAPQMYNSATGSNDGTSSGTMTSGDLVTGQLGDSLDFDGGNDYIDCGNIGSFSGKDIELMCWAKHDNLTNNPLLSKRINPGVNEFELATNPSSEMYIIFWRTGTDVSLVYTGYPSLISAGEQHHVRAFYDYATGDAEMWVNGVVRATAIGSGAIEGTTGTLRIAHNHYTRYHDGTIDEVRIANVRLTDDEYKTEYEIQNDPSTFWTYNTTTAVGGAGPEATDDASYYGGGP